MSPVVAVRTYHPVASQWILAVRNHKPQPHQHIVSPAAQRRGWGVCGSCGRMVGDWPQEIIDRMHAAMDRAAVRYRIESFPADALEVE